MLVLILFAVSIKHALSVGQMALVIAALAWLFPTRTIRAQVLTIYQYKIDNVNVRDDYEPLV